MIKLLFSAFLLMPLFVFSYGQEVHDKTAYAQKDSITILNSNVEASPLATYIERLNKLIRLENEWKIKTDFANGLIKIEGGDIVNSTKNELINPTLKIYISNESLAEINSDFSGIVLASTFLPNLAGSSKMKEPKVDANLAFIPPSGTYYMLLTLSELDNDGREVIRAKKVFPNQISF